MWFVLLRCLLLAISVLLPAHAMAGAWTLERGKTKAFVVSTFTYGDQGFDDDGHLITVPEYQKFELTAALEHGVRPWLTVLLKGELREETVDTLVVPRLMLPVAKSFGSVSGGARLRLYKAPNWVFSTQWTAMSGGFDDAGQSAPSDGAAVEARALLGVGRTVLGKHAFADIQGAYRVGLKSDDSDEMRFDVTIGSQLTPRTLVLGQTFSTFEVNAPVHYHKVGVSAVRQLNERVQIEVGGLATVYGRNALQEFGGKVGFWYNF